MNGNSCVRRVCNEKAENEGKRSDITGRLIEEIIKVRHEQGLTQRELEELSGVKQPIIARTENGSTVPSLSTVLKILAPLGKTLYIGDLKSKEKI